MIVKTSPMRWFVCSFNKKAASLTHEAVVVQRRGAGLAHGAQQTAVAAAAGHLRHVGLEAAVEAAAGPPEAPRQRPAGARAVARAAARHARRGGQVNCNNCLEREP